MNPDDRVELNRVYGKVVGDKDTMDILTGDNSLPNKKDYFRKKVDDYFLELINNRFDLYKTVMDDTRMREYIINQMFEHTMKSVGSQGFRL